MRGYSLRVNDQHREPSVVKRSKDENLPEEDMILARLDIDSSVKDCIDCVHTLAFCS